MKNLVIKLMFAVTLAFTIFSCSDDGNNDEITKLPTIAEIITADTQFSVLLKGLDISALSSQFKNAGSYTALAPTNIAFAAYTSTLFPTGITATTLQDPATLSTAQKAELKRILQYHILAIGTLSNDLLSAEYTKTFAAGVTTVANGTLSLFVNKVGNDVLINGGASNNGAKLISADINASNGVVHVIDKVLKLPTLVNHVIANPKLSTLLAVLSGTATTPGTFGDQSAVLAILSAPVATATPARTVYAPLNDAFISATTGTGFAVGATPAQITKVLQYHVETAVVNRLTNTGGTAFNVDNDIMVNTLLAIDPPTTPATFQQFTIQKGLLRIKETATTTFASGIKSINIQATNGVIHTIDRVLKPTGL